MVQKRQRRSARATDGIFGGDSVSTVTPRTRDFMDFRHDASPTTLSASITACAWVPELLMTGPVNTGCDTLNRNCVHARAELGIHCFTRLFE